MPSLPLPSIFIAVHQVLPVQLAEENMEDFFWKTFWHCKS